MRNSRLCACALGILALMGILTGCNRENGNENEIAPMNVKEAEGTKESSSVLDEPIIIPHAFGETVIETRPERIVTISWGNSDVPLALKEVPVGVSKANFGKMSEKGLHPWTEKAFASLGVEDPVVFDDTDGLDFEAISNAKPDVILAAYSGITQEEYDLLSQIAPVVAYPRLPWQTYWREQTLLDAKGMGKEVEAEKLIEKTEALMAEKMLKYKDVQDKTVAFLYFNPSNLGMFYVYLPADPRVAYLEDLGLKFPESVLELARNESNFSVNISAENADILKDADIIVTYGDESVLKVLQEDKLIRKIPAVANGSVALLNDDSELAAASTPTILSIPATIDEYLNLLNEAAKKVK